MRKGDVVRVTRPRQDHTERFFALVMWTDEREAGTYFGYEPLDPPSGQFGLPAHHCAWGAAWLRAEPRPYSPTVEVWLPAAYKAA